jgi:transcriptional regulator with XRE-family HTH domain
MRRSDTPEEALGAVITELRLRKQWSYHHVSSLVRCDPAYMNNIEHGKQNPTFGILLAIAQVHGIKLSRLIAMGERRHERGSKNRAAAVAAKVLSKSK